MTGNAAKEWAKALAAWAIPPEIIDQAPTSPWIHPPSVFVAPEHIPASPSHRIAAAAVPPQGSVLDVGCGGGLAAFALVPPAIEVAGVDQQPEMLDLFRQRAEKVGVSARTILGKWPAISAECPHADVVTCHHVVYNISEIEPFLLALNNHADHRVALELPQSHPLADMRDLWDHFWGITRPVGPGPADLMAVLADLGISAQCELWDDTPRTAVPVLEQVEHTRIRLCLSADRDAEIREYLAEHPRPSHRPVATIWWDIIR